MFWPQNFAKMWEKLPGPRSPPGLIFPAPDDVAANVWGGDRSAHGDLILPAGMGVEPISGGCPVKSPTDGTAVTQPSPLVSILHCRRPIGAPSGCRSRSRRPLITIESGGFATDRLPRQRCVSRYRARARSAAHRLSSERAPARAAPSRFGSQCRGWFAAFWSAPLRARPSPRAFVRRRSGPCCSAPCL
jgi:hypothetical protein